MDLNGLQSLKPFLVEKWNETKNPDVKFLFHQTKKKQKKTPLAEINTSLIIQKQIKKSISNYN